MQWPVHAYLHCIYTEDVEDGMVVLQALVEGMVLEVHVVDRPTTPGSVPAVEVYTQFGSQVRPVYCIIMENI